MKEGWRKDGGVEGLGMPTTAGPGDHPNCDDGF